MLGANINEIFWKRWDMVQVTGMKHAYWPINIWLDFLDSGYDLVKDFKKKWFLSIVAIHIEWVSE